MIYKPAPSADMASALSHSKELASPQVHILDSTSIIFHQLCFQAPIYAFQENLNFPHSLALFQFLRDFWSQTFNSSICSETASIMLKYTLQQKLHSFSTTPVQHMHLNKYISFHRQDHFVTNTGAKCSLLALSIPYVIVKNPINYR